MLTLYGYYRSSASYRVRIALALKNIGYEYKPINLLKKEQQSREYLKINPQGLVPSLVDDEGHVMTQSMAMIEYLEELHPTPALLPQAAHARARVRALALAIACEVAPITNLGVRNYLSEKLGASDEDGLAWIMHWYKRGIGPLEEMLATSSATGTFCHGDTPGMAECFLMPQLYNAKRYNLDLAPYPTIARIAAACEAHPAFIKAHPDNQPDTPHA